MILKIYFSFYFLPLLTQQKLFNSQLPTSAMSEGADD